jgi:hypothetical protein
LPRVAYITRMDRFILLSTLIVFVGLLHSAVNSALVAQGNANLADRIDVWSRVIYPISLLAALVISFLL